MLYIFAKSDLFYFLSVVIVVVMVGCLPLQAQRNLDNQFVMATVIPDKLLGRIEKQAKSLENRLQRKDDKYLARIKRFEKDLFKSLYAVDSVKAKDLLGNIDSTYAFFEVNTNELAKKSGVLQQYYNGKLDSVSTSLRFLQLSNSISSNFEHNNKIESAIHSYTSLQQRLTQSAHMENLLVERSQHLIEQIKHVGFVKDVRKYQQHVKYFQQQLFQAKGLIEQPDILAMKIVGLASQLPLFRAFMEKHSAFAAIFPQPENGSALLSMGSMQTRQSLQSQMYGTLGISDPQTELQQNLGQAEGQLKQIKEKLSSNSFGDAMDMPSVKTNEEKTKTFWKRLVWGGNVQSTRSDNLFPNTSDLGLSVGYKTNEKSIVGIGASYKLGWGRNWRHIQFTHEGVGLRSFLDWRLKGSIWFSGGAELNYRNRIEELGLLKDPDNWQQSALVGIARKFRVGKLKSDARVLYDFLWRQQVPRTQPLLFRVGYTF